MNLHSDTSGSEIIFAGKEFASDDEAYNFYNTHARNMRFGVRKNWINHRGLRMKLFVKNIIAIKRV